MKGGRCDAMFNPPINSSSKYVFIIMVKSKNKTSVNHDTKTMQSFNSCYIIFR